MALAGIPFHPTPDYDPPMRPYVVLRPSNRAELIEERITLAVGIPFSAVVLCMAVYALARLFI